MTKAEKYWVFGMIYGLTASVADGRGEPYAALFFLVIGAVCMLISARAAIKSKATSNSN